MDFGMPYFQTSTSSMFKGHFVSLCVGNWNHPDSADIPIDIPITVGVSSGLMTKIPNGIFPNVGGFWKADLSSGAFLRCTKGCRDCLSVEFFPKERTLQWEQLNHWRVWCICCVDLQDAFQGDWWKMSNMFVGKGWSILNSALNVFMIFSPPARRGLLDFIRAVLLLLLRLLCLLRLLARRLLLAVQIPVGTAGPPPRAPDPSGHCRISTASCRSQWALPDLNRDFQVAVGTAGPQPRLPARSGHCRTSTATSRSQWALPDLNGKNVRKDVR